MNDLPPVVTAIKSDELSHIVTVTTLNHTKICTWIIFLSFSSFFSCEHLLLGTTPGKEDWSSLEEPVDFSPMSAAQPPADGNLASHEPV